MRTQKEVNHYLQDNTVHVSAIYDIVKYLKDFNLKLPNNVILHEKGINQVDFFKWFESRSIKAGDAMGLGIPWEPCDAKDKYIIRRAGDTIVKGYNISCVLEFPTEEMRDAFYENFKDLIEQCKELL